MLQHCIRVFSCWDQRHPTEDCERWLVNCMEVVPCCIHHMVGFSRRKNTQIVSFVLFVFLQWGKKIHRRIHKLHCASMILVCLNVKNAALILSGGKKTAFGKSTLLEGIRPKSHLTCELWSTWIWLEWKRTERLSWWRLSGKDEEYLHHLKKMQ